MDGQRERLLKVETLLALSQTVVGAIQGMKSGHNTFVYVARQLNHSVSYLLEVSHPACRLLLDSDQATETLC